MRSPGQAGQAGDIVSQAVGWRMMAPAGPNARQSKQADHTYSSSPQFVAVKAGQRQAVQARQAAQRGCIKEAEVAVPIDWALQVQRLQRGRQAATQQGWWVIGSGHKSCGRRRHLADV